jgi:lysylphosphatidylglycerol synthetase-like protein (DUF2156 family)
MQSLSTFTSKDSIDKTTAGEFDFLNSYQLFSRGAHMGVLDPSYKLFTSQHGHGALVYKVKNGTAVVTGDPLCPSDQYKPLLREFKSATRLGLAFMGVSQDFAEYATRKGWTTMHFGRERALNPLTNKVLHQQAGKRLMAQNRKLLDSKRGKLTVDLYCPSATRRNPFLETEIQHLYDTWRTERNAKFGDGAQAFVTVFDLFSRPDITLYVYARDHEGTMVGMAALRSLAAPCGFHLDPCIASPSAPSGVSDLLLIISLMLLRGAGISYMSLGYEPFPELGDIAGQPKFQASIARWGYRRVIESLPVGGKAAYFDKFRPDDDLTSNLYIVVPNGPLQLRRSTALMHVANIKLRQVVASARAQDKRKKMGETPESDMHKFNGES